MNLDEFTDFIDNPNFIEGIFNYCDRWCERCAFTARCANFAMGEAQAANRSASDRPQREEFYDLTDEESRDAFWQELSGVFENTLSLLREMMTADGIDLEDPATIAMMDEEAALRAEAEEHPLAEQAFLYTEQALLWLEEAGALFADKEEELTTMVRLNVGGNHPEEQAVAIGDAVDVIQWYMDFIYVKLQRALRGQLEEQADPAAYAGYPSDADGSAKVALVAIDRSIGAWGQLLRYFPAQETALLERLARLDRLRRAVEHQFPNARAFVRPGFDTENQ